jgi:hypothetical protein
MGRCNAQTNTSASVAPKLIVEQSTARLSGTCAITKKEPPSQPTPRGLELINSCAKFYENGAGVMKPTLQIARGLGAVLNEPRTRQTFPSRRSKASLSSVVAMCSFLLILPSLALAILLWWASADRSAREPEVAATTASAATVQSVSPVVTPPGTLRAPAAAQTAANDQSGIIIRKVKTQPITVDARGESDRE